MDIGGFTNVQQEYWYEITLNDVGDERVSVTVQVSGNKITSINGKELTKPIDIPFIKSVNRRINKEKLKDHIETCVEHYLTCKK